MVDIDLGDFVVQLIGFFPYESPRWQIRDFTKWDFTSAWYQITGNRSKDAQWLQYHSSNGCKIGAAYLQKQIKCYLDISINFLTFCASIMMGFTVIVKDVVGVCFFFEQ